MVNSRVTAPRYHIYTYDSVICLCENLEYGTQYTLRRAPGLVSSHICLKAKIIREELCEYAVPREDSPDMECRIRDCISKKYA